MHVADILTIFTGQLFTGAYTVNHATALHFFMFLKFIEKRKYRQFGIDYSRFIGYSST